jgi:UrcA family protein
MKTISTTNLIAVAVIAGAFTAGFFSGPAMAQERQQDATPFEFEFQYSKQELSSAQNAKKLLRRLERRVRDYCGAERKIGLGEQEFVTACVTDTMKHSVSKFGSEALAQAYRLRADG